MNTRGRVAWWAARRHPRELARLSVVAGRHPKAVVRGIKIAKRALVLSSAVREAVTDPKAQADAKSAIASVREAALRVRKVGLANALEDKQVAEQLHRASAHASRAVAVARYRKPRRSFVLPLTATTSAAALAGAAYIGFNRYLGVHTRVVEIPEQPSSSNE